MATTKEFNISSNAVTVLNQTAEATNNARKELKELQKQMLSMDADSAEFQKAAARAGELKDQMNDAADAIRTSTGPALESMNNTFSIMSGQIANLDIGGLGQSFTSLGRAVGKINLQTLKSELSGLVSGLGNLAGAIISNPLLALGGMVAALVLNFDKINAALSGTAEKVEKLGEANYALEKQNSILDARINKEKTLNGESFKTLALEKEKAQNNIKVAENELAIARTTGDINVIREKENKLIEMRNLLSGITNKGEADRIKLVEEAKNLVIKGYKEEQERQAVVKKFEDARQQQLSVIAQKQREINAALEVEKLSGQQKYETQRANFVEQNIETKKVLVQSERQKQLQADLNKLIEEEKIIREATVAVATNTTVQDLKKEEVKLNKENNKEISKGNDELEKLLEANAVKAAKELEFEKHLSDEKIRIREEYALANMGEQAKELYELEKKKEKELQTWEGAEEDKIWIEDKYRVLELQLNKKYDDALLEQKQETNDKEKQQAEDLAKAKLEAEKQLYEARWGLATASVDLLGALFAKNKKAADVAFALEKGLAVAKIIVDTQAEIAGYYAANAAAGPAGMAVASAQALAAKIRAATSIATIAGTTVAKFMNGSGSAASGSTGGTGGGGSASGTQAPSPANFAFLGMQPNQQPPLQAYVVSGQVSSNLEAQQLINNQARLGG